MNFVLNRVLGIDRCGKRQQARAKLGATLSRTATTVATRLHFTGDSVVHERRGTALAKSKPMPCYPGKAGKFHDEYQVIKKERENQDAPVYVLSAQKLSK